MMITHATAFVAAAAAVVVLDALWLGVIARSFFSARLGPLMADQVNFLAAALFYVLYVAGIVFFAVRPALADGDWRTAALHGAFLGLVAYGTYDLTNLAVLKGWSTQAAVVDIAWGVAMTALAACAGYAAARQVI